MLKEKGPTTQADLASNDPTYPTKSPDLPDRVESPEPTYPTESGWSSAFWGLRLLMVLSANLLLTYVLTVPRPHQLSVDAQLSILSLIFSALALNASAILAWHLGTTRSNLACTWFSAISISLSGFALALGGVI